MRLRNWLGSWVAVVAAVTTLGIGTGAQAAGYRLVDPDPNWKELDTPPPPAYSPQKMLKLELAKRSMLDYAFDPASISIGKDEVIRLVIVAYSSTGGYNAIYQGIRCTTGEYKVYARQFSPNGEWSPVKDPSWQNIYATSAALPALEFARQGGCDNLVPRRTVNDMIREFKLPANVNER